MIPHKLQSVKAGFWKSGGLGMWLRRRIYLPFTWTIERAFKSDRAGRSLVSWCPRPSDASKSPRNHKRPVDF